MRDSIEKVVEFFTIKGYMKGVLGHPKLGLVFKLLPDQKLNYVCFMDNRESLLTVPAQVSGVMDKCREALCQRFPDRAEGMTGMAMILTEEAERDRMLIPEGRICWLMDTLTRQLMVFDDQPFDVYDVRQVSEEFLDRNPLTVRAHQILSLLTPVCVSLILINIIVHVVLEFMGDTQDVYFMAEHGAMIVVEYVDGVLKTFWETGEYYRLLTSCFLHFGISHLFFNMITLFYLGGMTERIVGSVRFGITYILCGIGSSIVSVIWDACTGELGSVSAGASGAISGIGGMLSWIFILGLIQKDTRVSFYRVMIFMAILLTNGLGEEGVGYISHVSGFLIGFIMGILLYHGRNRRKEESPVVEPRP